LIVSKLHLGYSFKDRYMSNLVCVNQNTSLPNDSTSQSWGTGLSFNLGDGLLMKKLLRLFYENSGLIRLTESHKEDFNLQYSLVFDRSDSWPSVVS